MLIKCPKCELNYIDENEDCCDVCKDVTIHRKGVSRMDSNKAEVERYLLPFLRAIPEEKLMLFTGEEESFKVFKLRLPLLVECKYISDKHCREEIIVDNSNVYRYYVQPYYINGKYYHICSQWWSSGQEFSKDILYMIKKIKL